MVNKRAGFTIVELLIVIVVIAILATITIVAYNGVKIRAMNSSSASEVQQWKKLLEGYKAIYNSYPPVTAGSYCLGTGFPNGHGNVARCRNFQSSDSSYSYLESANIPLMNELKKVGTLPMGTRVPILTNGNGYVGPYIYIEPTGYYMETFFRGNDASACPAGMEYGGYTDGNAVLCAHNTF